MIYLFHHCFTDTWHSLDGPCAHPGFRKIDLDPYQDILPNATLNEDAAWVVDNYMNCATTEDGNGCNCNISARAHNPLSGKQWYDELNDGVEVPASNNDPNGLNTHTFFNDELSPQDYLEYFMTPPNTRIGRFGDPKWLRYPNNG